MIFLLLKLLWSFCCPQWHETSYNIHLSLFYLYVRTLMKIFSLVIHVFHSFVDLSWIVYLFFLPLFSLYFSFWNFCYFSVRLYGLTSGLFNVSVLFSIPLPFCYTFSVLSSNFYIDYLMTAITLLFSKSYVFVFWTVFWFLSFFLFSIVWCSQLSNIDLYLFP